MTQTAKEHFFLNTQRMSKRGSGAVLVVYFASTHYTSMSCGSSHQCLYYSKHELIITTDVLKI